MTPTTTYTQALVRIKELENEAARWRHAHDEIVKYAADKSEEARESLQEAGEEIAAIRRALATIKKEYRSLSDHAEEVEAENVALRTKLEGWLYCYIGISAVFDSYNFDEWIASEDSKSWREDMALAKGGKG